MHPLTSIPPAWIPLLQVTLQAFTVTIFLAGLFYTAMQFRNYRRAQHVANFTKMVEMQMHLREMRVNDPALARVYQHDVTGLPDNPAIRAYFFNLMQLSVFEIVWFAHQHGQVPSDYFRSWDARMREIAAEPSFRAMMASPAMKIMHDRFQVYMQAVIAATPERPANPADPHRPAPLAQPPAGVDGSTGVSLGRSAGAGADGVASRSGPSHASSSPASR